MRDRMSFLGMKMARRTNRRWLVAVTYLSLIALWTILGTLMGDRGQALSFAYVLLAASLVVNGIIFGGYGCWGLIKPFSARTPSGAPTPRHNDERELRRRDRMHFYAYRVVVALMVLAFFVGRHPFRNPEIGNALILGVLVLGLTLPQALLLWIEPDMDFEESEAQN